MQMDTNKYKHETGLFMLGCWEAFLEMGENNLVKGDLFVSDKLNLFLGVLKVVWAHDTKLLEY